MTENDVSFFIVYEDFTVELNRPPTEQELCFKTGRSYIDVIRRIARIRQTGQIMELTNEYGNNDEINHREILASNAKKYLGWAVAKHYISGRHFRSEAYPDAWTYAMSNIGKSREIQ